MAKTFVEKLVEIKQDRKLLHKVFIEKSTGDHYQLLMFAHDQDENLLAILVLSVHSAIKVARLANKMEADFDLFEPNKGEKHDSANTTT